MWPAAEGLDEPGNGLALHYPEFAVLPVDNGLVLLTAASAMPPPDQGHPATNPR